MKAIVFFKIMFVTAVMIISISAVNAGTPQRITNDEVDSYNHVTAKMVYDKNGENLKPVYRFEFKYDNSDRVVEKKAFKWDGFGWSDFYVMVVKYSGNEASIIHSMWNDKTKKYSEVNNYTCNVDDVDESLK